jgi:hypothetical protein
MPAWLKVLLEWTVLVALAAAFALGLTWLPFEKSMVQLGLLIVGILVSIYAMYLYVQIWKFSEADDDFDMSNWPADPDEVKP